MSTATEPQATPKAIRHRGDRVVLEDVPYGLYVRLRALEANNHHRMLYHNGTLEIMSPGYRHDYTGRKIGIVVRAVAVAFGVSCLGSGSTTFHIGELKKKRGSGAEADEGFYFANETAIRGKVSLNLRVDPPPDLWIEVDDGSRPRGRKRAVLAELRIPELWRYSAIRDEVRFFRLDGEQFLPIERSLSLPMLTPAHILEALHLADDKDETTWWVELRRWSEALPHA